MSTYHSPIEIKFQEVEIDHIKAGDRASSSHRIDPNSPKIPRPPNAFIIYRSEQIKILKEGGAPKKPQSDISKLIGTMWRSETAEVRKWFEHQAELRKLEHAEQYPNYQYRPVRKAAVGKGIKVAAPNIRKERSTIEPESKRRPAPKVSTKSRQVSSPLSSLESTPVPQNDPISRVVLPSPPPVSDARYEPFVPAPRIIKPPAVHQQLLDSYSLPFQSRKLREDPAPLAHVESERGSSSRTVYNAREERQATQQSSWNNYSISQEPTFPPNSIPSNSVPRQYQETWAPYPTLKPATYQPIETPQYSYYTPSLPAQQDISSAYQTYSAGFSSNDWNEASRTLPQWNRESYSSLYAASTYAHELQEPEQQQRIY